MEAKSGLEPKNGDGSPDDVFEKTLSLKKFWIFKEFNNNNLEACKLKTQDMEQIGLGVIRSCE